MTMPLVAKTYFTTSFSLNHNIVHLVKIHLGNLDKAGLGIVRLPNQVITTLSQHTLTLWT